jgi:hypothetical protein
VRERAVSLPVTPPGSREVDLYPLVRDFLVAQGFTVRSEVRGCDVTATKGERMVVVELKLGLTLELLAQAVRRQKVADLVYVAVPRPASAVREARLRENLPLLRQLELGLLLIDFRDTPPGLEVALQPTTFQRRRNPRERQALLREVALRSGDDNAGGTRGRPLVTAYRENALCIAAELARGGAMEPKQLRALGTGEKTLSILRDNVYEWFERIDRALYRLNAAGVSALVTYADVVRRIEARKPVVVLPAPIVVPAASTSPTTARRRRPKTPASA